MPNFILPVSFLAGYSMHFFLSFSFPSGSSTLFLLIFLFCIGRELGLNFRSGLLKSAQINHFIILTLLNIVGSLLGGALVGLLLPTLTMKDGILIASSMGFYSVGGVLIGNSFGTHLGILTFFVNFLREETVMVFGTFLARIHPHINIHLSGAAALDTCLGTIRKTSDSSGLLLSLTSGGILTLIVPILINGLLHFFSFS